MRVHLCMNTELVVSDQVREIEKMMQMARQLRSPHKPFSPAFYQQIQRVAMGYKKSKLLCQKRYMQSCLSINILPSDSLVNTMLVKDISDSQLLF